MTTRKLSDLYEKYPLILKNHHFECNDGWYDIIDTLCSNIQHKIDWHNATGKYSNHEPKQPLMEQVVAVQIKEKFGGLRFYVNHGNDQIYGMIEFAESLSFKVCENCGAPGKCRSDNGWWRTRCENHLGDR